PDLGREQRSWADLWPEQLLRHRKRQHHRPVGVLRRDQRALVRRHRRRRFRVGAARRLDVVRPHDVQGVRRAAGSARLRRPDEDRRQRRGRAISSNVYTEANDFLGVRITVLNKAQLVAGATAIDTASFGPIPSYYSLVPAQSMTSTSTQWYAGLDPAFARVARIVETEGTPPASVTLTEAFTPSIKRVSVPPNAEQKGTITLLPTGDTRVDNVVWQSN